MERRMLNVKLKDRVRNTTFRQRTRVTDIVQYVTEDQNVVGEMTLWGKKERYGQRKMGDSGGGLHPAVEGHSLE